MKTLSNRFSSPLATIVAAWLILGITAPSASASEVGVEISSPEAGTPVFGEVEVTVRVSSDAAVERVEILVDGVRVAELHEPPYHFKADVGEENRSHRFEAVAHGASGIVGRALVETPEVKIHEQIDLDLQQVYVTVTRNGRRVRDLQQTQFALRDEGEPQEIVTFAHGNIPFTAVLLIDASFSMEGTKLEAARRGARSFVAGMEELDELRLMVFSDRLVTASPFSHETEALIQALEAAGAEGGTAVNDFLFQALSELEQRQGRRVVLVLSDGKDVHSVLDMEAVREIARRSQAQIYWLRMREGIEYTTEIDDTGLGSRREVIRYPRSHGRVNSWRGQGQMRKQRRTLERTVEESGGRVMKIESIDVVEEAFQEVLSELRDQYALGYYPQPRRNDRSWRALQVNVRTDGLKTRTREGYIDW